MIYLILKTEALVLMHTNQWFYPKGGHGVLGMNLDMNVTNYLKVCNQNNMPGRRTKQCIPSALRALHDLRVFQTKTWKSVWVPVQNT